VCAEEWIVSLFYIDIWKWNSNIQEICIETVSD